MNYGPSDWICLPRQGFVRKDNQRTDSPESRLVYTRLEVALQILERKITKIQKYHPYTPKAFYFSFIKPQYSKAIQQQVKSEIYYGPGPHRRETQSIFT